MNNILKYLFAKINKIRLVGEVVPYAGIVAPNGYLICDGQAISRTTYANLFAVIGTTFGAGDSSTTFNIPNIKGRVITGYDVSQTEFNAIGKVSGAKTHTLTAEQIPPHNHANGSYNQLLTKDGSNTTGLTDNSSGEPRVNASATLVTIGGGQSHNNLQPYIVLNHLIKY
jgi:microcystin-dependent protein